MKRSLWLSLYVEGYSELILPHPAFEHCSMMNLFLSISVMFGIVLVMLSDAV